ncbi:MAG: FtsX-like permease family protein [Pseudomonadota bacterium]
MTIRPIFSALLRNRTGAILVVGQIALTLAIVVNAVFIIQQRLEHIGRATGMDVNNIVSTRVQGFGNEYDHLATVREDLAMLNALPGVVASAAMESVPLSGSGSANGFRDSDGEEPNSEVANYYRVSEGVMETLGVTLYAGRMFSPEEVNWRSTEEQNGGFMPSVAVISKDMAEALYETPDVVGRMIYNNLGQGAQIIGVIDRMMGSWVNWPNVMQVVLLPEVPERSWTRYAIRVEPGKADEMVPVIEEALENRDVQRVVNATRTMQNMAEHAYSRDNAVAVILMIVVVLLFIVAGLGIVGLASFTVNQRTKQIGTRRAIGARKRDIISYFMTENWLLTSIGVAIGSILAVALNIWLSDAFGLERLNYWYVPAGIAALWLLGLLAAAGPARRASNISPAVATRTV